MYTIQNSSSNITDQDNIDRIQWYNNDQQIILQYKGEYQQTIHLIKHVIDTYTALLNHSLM